LPVPLKATFFALKRREPRGVLARLLAVHSLLCSAFATIAFGAGFFALVLLGETLEAESVGELAILLVLFAMGTLGYFVANASFDTACLRWFIRGQRSGFLGFSLATDTWRVFAGHWLWFAIWAPLVVVAATAANLLAEVTAAMGSWPLWLLLAAALLLAIRLALRFAPGGGASIATGRFAYFQGARAAKGRFWSLLSSFATIWAAVALIWIALFIALGMSVFAVTGDNPENADAINFAMTVVLVAVTLVVHLTFTLLSAGINARAVIAAVDEGKLEGVTVNVAEVFS
jgi:hypothetical protein